MKKLILLFITAGLFAACDSDSKGKDKYDRNKSSAEGREKDDYSSDNKANSDHNKSSDNKDNNNLDTKTSSSEPDNNGTSTVSGWPQSERKGFINSCERRAIAEGGDKLTAQSFCQCMLDKMEARYPDIKVAAKLTKEQVNEFGEQNRAECLEEH